MPRPYVSFLALVIANFAFYCSAGKRAIERVAFDECGGTKDQLFWQGVFVVMQICHAKLHGRTIGTVTVAQGEVFVHGKSCLKNHDRFYMFHTLLPRLSDFRCRGIKQGVCLV